MRTVHRGEHAPSNVEPIRPVPGLEHRAPGLHVEPALHELWVPTRARSSSRPLSAERLQHELERAAARQPEALRLLIGDAVGGELGLVLRDARLRTRSIMSSSTQPPDTEPTTMPSSRIAVSAPIGRGAEPHVFTMVASATRCPLFLQPSAVRSTSMSTLSMRKC